jgi:hypothetical protein
MGGASMGNRAYLLIVDDEGNCYLGSSWPLGIEGVLAIANEISWEIIVIIPFILLDLRCI